MSSHLWKVTAKKAVGKVAKGMEAEVVKSGTTANIRVAGWNSGHYVVRIESDDQVVTKKLIIK